MTAAKEAIGMLYLRQKIDAFLAEWKANLDRKLVGIDFDFTGSHRDLSGK